MSAAPPAKRPTESDVDAVIEKIDAALPRLYQRAEETKRFGQSPSDGFSLAKIEQTRQAFSAMREDNLLTRSGMDIQMNDEDHEEAPAPKVKTGGKTHVRHPSSPARHKLYYRPSG